MPIDEHTTLGTICPGFPTAAAQLTHREEEIFTRRLQAACVQLANARTYSGPGYSVPNAVTPDETAFANYDASFHKLLQHDAHGSLSAVGIASYLDLLAGLKTSPIAAASDFDQARLNAIALAPGGVAPARVLVNPQASKSFPMLGIDPAAIAFNKIIDPAGLVYPTVTSYLGVLSFASPETAAELVELYGKAILRNLPFDQYTMSHPDVSLVVNALNAYGATFKGPKAGGGMGVTAETLFRGASAGDLIGGYLSQFLLQRRPPLFPAGCASFVASITGVDTFADRFGRSYEVPEPNRREFGVTLCDFVEIQNGGIPRKYVSQDFLSITPIRTGRQLGSAVHVDSLHEMFTFALDILTAGSYPRPTTSPYNDPAGLPTAFAKNEGDGPTLGPPDAYGMLGAVAIRSIRAGWTQKWLVARRGRPEVLASLVEKGDARIHATVIPGSAPSIPNGSLFARVRQYNGEQEGVLGKWGYAGSDPSLVPIPVGGAQTLLLSQMFPEGSPAHPAWPSGHAVVAGACATVLKAIFDDRAFIRDPSASRGTEVPMVVNGAALLVGGELDKLASNMAFGRNFAGVHFRSDAEDGILLGEEIALTFLQDVLREYAEGFPGGAAPQFVLTKRRGDRVLITAAAVTIVTSTTHAIPNQPVQARLSL